MNAKFFNPKTSCVPFSQCPAKAFKNEYGVPELGLNVLDHMRLVGDVFKVMTEIFPQKLNLELDFFPKGSELIAACHDIGKISPTFYLKLATLVSTNPVDYHPQLLRDHLEFVSKENSEWGGHATVSATTVSEYQAQKTGKKDKYIHKIVGSHHGSLFKNYKRLSPVADYHGGEEWLANRFSAIESLIDYFKTDFPEITNEAQARVLAGMVTVCDWIGSSDEFVKDNQEWSNLTQRLRKAISDAGFNKINLKEDIDIEFPFGKNFILNELQKQAFNHCILQGLIFIEAPMGMGKTETAFLICLKALLAELSTGIYFGLPTQLTSNKIFERFNQFLNLILLDSTHRTQLVHSNAWLINTNFDKDGEIINSWLDHSKRKLLARFAVGTLDQAVMSVINVKHSFVRSFGLLGKVVILDEVHSYDVYTGLLMDELIKHLLELKCTVIILSATLTQARKKEMLGIDYEVNSAFPLITTYDPKTKAINQIPVAHNAANEKSVQIVLSNELNSFQEALERAKQGQYILWIENTIDESYKAFTKFHAELFDTNVECGLLHSRFTFTDRQAIEDKWVELFGKNNPDRENRKGKVLIGTQILEQSLDIDADFLVTRICPIDLLLQRTGRLWRHNRSNRHPQAKCEMHVLTPSFELAIANEGKDFGASGFVYYPYILFKTLFVIQKHLEGSNTIEIPMEMTYLMESVYGEDDEQLESILGTYKDMMLNGHKDRIGLNELRQKARSNLAKLGMPLKDDDMATTRYIEKEDVQLILLQSLQLDASGSIQSMTLFDGSVIRFEGYLDHRTKKDYALKLTQNQVKMSETKLGKDFEYPALDNGIKSLLSFTKKMLICLVEQDIVREINGTPINEKLTFNYTSQTGLTFKANA